MCLFLIKGDFQDQALSKVIVLCMGSLLVVKPLDKADLKYIIELCCRVGPL